jgi:hypothetical protein
MDALMMKAQRKRKTLGHTVITGTQGSPDIDALTYHSADQGQPISKYGYNIGDTNAANANTFSPAATS